MEEYDFLGRGFHFPVKPDSATGRFKEASAEDDIRQAMGIILSTKKGERIMHPDFGCGIHDFMFGTVEYTSLSQMEQSVRDALIRWEPRIMNNEVKVVSSPEAEGVLLVHIGYTVRATNNRYNMVYPFYISEGIGGG